MTVARAYSATVAGLEGRTVVVEAAIGAGLPALTIVGLPDAAVKECRERVRSALRHVGFPLPPKNRKSRAVHGRRASRAPRIGCVALAAIPCPGLSLRPRRTSYGIPTRRQD